MTPEELEEARRQILKRYGMPTWEDFPVEAEGMFSPVRCTHCRGIYDLGKVTVISRYLDCSVWRSPCCDLAVDDRGEGPFGKSRPDYTELRKR